MNIGVLLQEFLNKNYLLHGSPHDISGKIEPRQACDLNRESGNLIGIYATNDVAIAMFNAVIHRPQKGDSLSGWNFDDNKKEFFGKNISLAVGHVYILPSDTFQKTIDDDGEFVSLTACPPQDKIFIDPEIFKEYCKENNISLNLAAS